MTNKKFLLLSASITAFIAAGLAVVIASGINNSTSRLAANEVADSSVTFNKSTTRTRITSSKYSFETTTDSGNSVYAISSGQGVMGTSEFGSMKGSEETNYVVFTGDLDNPDVPAFQNIKSVTITTGSKSDTNSFKIYNSTSGSPVCVHTDSSKGAKETTITTEVEGSSYLKITSGDTLNWFDIASVTITYGCKNVEGKEVVALVLNGGDRTYDIGSTFAFDGTAKAYYSDKTSKDVTSEIIIEKQPDMYTTGATRATFSYTEDEVTVTANFDIEIEGSKPTGSKTVTYSIYGDDGIDYDKSILPSFVESTGTLTLKVFVKDGFVLYDVLYNLQDSLTQVDATTWTLSVTGLPSPIEIWFVISAAE